MDPWGWWGVSWDWQRRHAGPDSQTPRLSLSYIQEPRFIALVRERSGGTRVHPQTLSFHNVERILKVLKTQRSRVLKACFLGMQMSELKKTRGQEWPSRNGKRAEFLSSGVNSLGPQTEKPRIAAFTFRNMNRNNRKNIQSLQSGVGIHGREAECKELCTSMTVTEKVT